MWKLPQWSSCAIITGTSLILAQSALGNVAFITEMTAGSLMLAQRPASNVNVVQITKVRAERTESGVQIIVETLPPNSITGEIELRPVPSFQNRVAFSVIIPNAKLNKSSNVANEYKKSLNNLLLSEDSVPSGEFVDGSISDNFGPVIIRIDFPEANAADWVASNVQSNNESPYIVSFGPQSQQSTEEVAATEGGETEGGETEGGETEGGETEGGVSTACVSTSDPIIGEWVSTNQSYQPLAFKFKPDCKLSIVYGGPGNSYLTIPQKYEIINFNGSRGDIDLIFDDGNRINTIFEIEEDQMNIELGDVQPGNRPRQFGGGRRTFIKSQPGQERYE